MWAKQKPCSYITKCKSMRGKSFRWVQASAVTNIWQSITSWKIGSKAVGGRGRCCLRETTAPARSGGKGRNFGKAARREGWNRRGANCCTARSKRSRERCNRKGKGRWTVQREYLLVLKNLTCVSCDSEVMNCSSGLTCFIFWLLCCG